MIKNRNIDDNAAIAIHKIAGAGGLGAFGNVFYVDYRNGSDNNSGTRRDDALKTLGGAHSVVTSNNNDIVIVDGDSTIAETAMVTWSKNRVHVIGDNGPFHPYGLGNGAKVSIGVTTPTTDTALLRVTGVRNTFTGLKFISNNTLAQALHTVEDGGEYTRFNHCEFYKSDKLTTAAVSELLANGDSSVYNRCTFGSLVDSRGGAGAPRACVKISRETLTGKVARDVVFNDCLFLQKAAHADANIIYGSGTTDVERMLLLVRPIMINAVLASATIADAITFGGAQTEGNIILVDPTASNITAFSEASQNVFVQGAVPTAATTGIAVEVAA